MIDNEIKIYIEENILPKYENFDKAHKINHAEKVIENSLEIAKKYEVDINMVYIIAAFHDIGLENGRKYHHIDSGKILMKDKFLKERFSLEERIMMSEAVEDHRASNDYEPRSIYGKIVSEGDRDLGYKNIIRRTIEFSISNFSEYNMEEHYKRTYDHIESKYGENGYIKLWLETELNKNNLKIIREKLNNKLEFEKDFELIYNNLI